MGCWNGTCALTNLPIVRCEKVYLFILKKNPYFKTDEMGNGFCHPGDIMSPFSLPLLGEYDDYGRVEDIKDKTLTKDILKSLKYKKSILELQEDISQNMREDENAKACGYTPFRELSFVIMHKWAVEKTWDLYDKYQEEFSFREEPLTWKEVKHYLLSYSGNSYLDDSFLEGIGLERDIFKRGEARKEPKIKIKEQLINHVKFCSVFSILRRLWIPGSGAGSQDNTYVVHRDMLQASYDFTKERIKKDKEEDC